MSGTGLDFAYPLSDDEEQQKARLNATALGGALVKARSLVSSDPTSSGVAGYIPGQGAVASTLNFIKSADPYIQKANDFVSNFSPTGMVAGLLAPSPPKTSLPEMLPDVFDWAAKTEAATDKHAEDTMPHIVPENQGEQNMYDFGKSAAALGIPIPGAKAGMTGLKTAAEAAGPVARIGERVLSGAVHTLLPSVTSTSNFGIGTVLSGLGTALNMQSPQDAPAPTDTLPATSATASTPPSGGLLVSPANAAGNEPPAPPSNATPIAPPAKTPPQQAAEGDIPVPYAAPKGDSMFYPITPTTLGETAVALVSAAALIKGGPRAMKFIEELGLGTRATQFHEASAPFNAERTAIESGLPVVPKESAPLPPTVGSIANRADEQVFDKSAVINKYTDVAAASKTEAELLRTETGTYNNNQIFQQRLSNFLQTGHDEQTGVRMPTHEGSWKKYATLSKDDQAAYDAARYAGDELDNRTRIGKTQPLAAPDESHVGQAYRDDTSLKGDIAFARSKPEVAALLDENRVQHDRIAEIMMWSGMIDHQTMMELKNLHPNYLPTGTFEGLIENPLRARDLTPWSGDLTARIPAVELDKQHIDRLMAARDANQLRSNVIQTGYDFQQRDPQGARIFSPSKNSKGEWVSAEGTLPVRINGELQHHYVGNAVLRNALDQSPAQAGAVINGLNHLRQWTQSSITGTIAMVTGHVFPFIGPMRYAPQMAITRTGEEFGGHMEKFFRTQVSQKLRFGDPTAAVTWPYEILAATGAKGSQSLAKLLHPEADNWINVKLRATKGDSYVNALHNTLQRTWENSIRGEMERGGAINAAGMTYTPTPIRGVGAGPQARGVTSVANDLVPETFRTNGWFPTMTPYAVKFKNFVNDVKSIVGESAHAQFFRLNSHLGDEARVLATRGIVGDPGVHGANKVLRGLSQATEYQNIALQEGKAVASRIAKSPMEVAFNAMTVFGTAALAEAFSAMMAGPDHVAHYENEVSSGAPARYSTIYIPGQPPEAALKIPTGINVSWMYPFIRQVMAEAISLKSHTTDHDVASWAWHGLTDFFGKHVLQDTWDSTVQAASRGIPPVLPEAASTGVSLLTGRNVDLTLGNVYDRGSVSSPISGGDPRAPGRVQGADTLTGSVQGNVWKQTLASAFGIAGSAVKDAVETYHNVTVNGGDKFAVASNLIQAYKGRLQDSVPYLNGILWNKADNLSGKTPLVARVDDARNVMRQFSGYKGDIIWEGHTRAGGPELPMAPDQASKVPKDPVLRSMYIYSALESQKIERFYMKDITDLEKQRAVLRNSPLSPEVVTQQKNELTRNIQAKYERVAGIINQLNDHLSGMAGKRVTINTIDFGGTADQFK